MFYSPTYFGVLYSVVQLMIYCDHRHETDAKLNQKKVQKLKAYQLELYAAPVFVRSSVQRNDCKYFCHHKYCGELKNDSVKNLVEIGTLSKSPGVFNEVYKELYM